MIMGISMLQGGHVRVVGKNSPAEDEQPQVSIEPHTSSDPAMPEDLKGLPIFTPNKDDIEVITNGDGAGKKTVKLLGPLLIINASFEDIWDVDRQ